MTGFPALEVLGGFAYINTAIRTRVAFPREQIEREAIKAGAEVTIRPIEGPEDSEREWALVMQMRAGAGVAPGVLEEASDAPAT